MTVLSRIPDEWVARRAFVSAKRVNLKVDFAGGQGRVGRDAAVLAPVLQRADRAGHPAYLEATSPRNKALYERHGFRTATPFAVAGGPPLWPMWRDPA